MMLALHPTGAERLAHGLSATGLRLADLQAGTGRLAAAPVLSAPDGEPLTTYETLPRQGGLLIVPVLGVLTADCHMPPMMTSYYRLQDWLAQAAADDTVAGVALRVDSAGGLVSQCFETVEILARLGTVKPTAAVIDTEACSAAYALAAACGGVIAPETAHVGSVGVIATHLSYARQLKAAGVDVTVFRSPARKAEGVPEEPLAEQATAAITRDIVSLAGYFRRRVEAFRPGIGPALDAAEGDSWLGPDRIAEALDGEVIDAIAWPDDAIAALAQQVST